MNIQPVFEAFGRLLQQRLDAGVCTTEDSIRYTFYHAVTSVAQLDPIDMILEHPHSALPGAKIDTIVRGGPGREAIAIEFKYDRANPGGTNQNRTQRAAAAFADIFRLAKVPLTLAAIKYFVYVTDAEMAGYFKNRVNRLADIFDTPDRKRFDIGITAFEDFSKTFRSKVAPLCCDCYISRVYGADLSPNHIVRVWEVAV
jgi:hypothetical protein